MIYSFCRPLNQALSENFLAVMTCRKQKLMMRTDLIAYICIL